MRKQRLVLLAVVEIALIVIIVNVKVRDILTLSTIPVQLRFWHFRRAYSQVKRNALMYNKPRKINGNNYIV